MPIHEFRCTSCDYTFELLLMSRDEMEDVRCPRCQSPDIDKLMSAANVTAGDPASSGGTSSAAPQAQHRSCGTGSCSTFELPGHKK